MVASLGVSGPFATIESVPVGRAFHLASSAALQYGIVEDGGMSPRKRGQQFGGGLASEGVTFAVFAEFESDEPESLGGSSEKYELT